LIDSAVLETSMDVLLSQDSSLAPTFFHANCGGQIADPEWVWNSSINGLCSFEDPFCRHTKQATWIKSIPLEKWTNHFSSTYDFPVHDSICFGLLTNFNQEQRRSFFIHPMFGIPLRDIRESFRLKSTFFSVALLEKNVILTGKGFGHGVGLCQEGAMNMAKKGYKANEILDFYFPNAELHTNWLTHE
jgi:stage II sporulation protein D